MYYPLGEPAADPQPRPRCNSGRSNRPAKVPGILPAPLGHTYTVYARNSPAVALFASTVVTIAENHNNKDKRPEQLEEKLRPMDWCLRIP